MVVNGSYDAGKFRKPSFVRPVEHLSCLTRCCAHTKDSLHLNLRSKFNIFNSQFKHYSLQEGNFCNSTLRRCYFHETNFFWGNFPVNLGWLTENRIWIETFDNIPYWKFICFQCNKLHTTIGTYFRYFKA